MYALSDMSIADVAIALRLKPAAAKSRIFRARAAMRDRLRGVWPKHVERTAAISTREDLFVPVPAAAHPVFGAGRATTA